MKKLALFTLIFFELLSWRLNAQGYEISLKMPQLQNQQIILGHYFSKNDLMIPDDTLILDKKGFGTFKGDSLLPKGLYFMFLPSGQLFEFIVFNNQNFSIENDTSDLVKNRKVIGDKENQLFSDLQKFRSTLFKKINDLNEEYKNSNDEKRKKEIEKILRELYESDIKKKKEIIESNPNTFFAEFLKATLEVEIPKNISQQKEQYYYYRNNYFNYFDFKNPGLLRTPIYEGKLDYYLDKVLPQIPDTVIFEVDRLINNSRHNKELFRYMLVHLFQKYKTGKLMGSENVYVHVLEKYYLKESSWSSEETIKELEADYNRKKNALIGMIAPELKMISLPKDKDGIEAIREALESMKEKGNEFLKNENLIKEKMSLHKPNFPNLTDSALRSHVIINELATMLEEQLLPNFDGYISLNAQAAKYTILWFWEPDCSHCKEATPKLSKAYDDKKLKDKGVIVIPIYAHKNINEWDKYTKNMDTWLDFILKHNMLKWINVWEPFGYSHFRDKYDISNTPILYLLDENKKIIAKHISYEQAIEIIEEMEKNEKKNIN